MPNVRVEIRLDPGKFTRELAHTQAQIIATNVRNDAKTFVRKDTLNLTGSIRTNRITDDHYETITDTPYSAAQEYGRPDLPNYGFTPFMRPAAALTKVSTATRRAVLQAIRDARRGARIFKVFNV